jgi:hypothetical protein
MKNLREDYNWGKLAILQFRTFYLAAIYICKDDNINKTIILPIGVKLGL